MNFHPPFSEPPSFFFLLSYPSNIEIIFDFSDIITKINPPPPPISKSWIRPCQIGSKFALLACGNFQTFKVASFKTDRVQCMHINFYMFYACEKSISRKYPVPPIEKFPSLKLPMNVLM